MIGLGVNSVGNHNYPLCWSIIPHNTGGELTYTGTFIELQEAVMLVNNIRTYPDPDCAFCNTFDEHMRNERVKKFCTSKEFTEERKLPDDTAQCDQITGWCNFTRKVLGIDPNTCKNHLLGDCLYLTYLFAWLIIFFAIACVT